MRVKMQSVGWMLLAGLAQMMALPTLAQGAPGKCPPYPDGRKPDAAAIVAAIDRNHDGKMTHEEWQAADAPEASWDYFMQKPDIKAAGHVTREQFLTESPPPGIDTDCDGKITMAEFIATKKWIMSGRGAGASCDRACLGHSADQVLSSLLRQDPGSLPLAPMYRLTVNNAAAAPSMATPWRTITGVVGPGVAQYVIDVPQQQVFFTATVQEGSMPSLLWARLKLDAGKLAEIELYLGRSRAESGMQFDPIGATAAKLPQGWTATIPEGARPSREELIRVAHADFDPAFGSLKRGGDCKLVENGQTVVAQFGSVEELLEHFPGAAPKTVERVRRSLSTGEAVPIPCVDAEPPVDREARIVVDEEQAVVVTLATVPGIVWPNFAPPPGLNREYPTAYVPQDMKQDNQQRAKAFNGLVPDPAQPVPRPTYASLAVAEMNRFYAGEIQATHRLMQIQPPGSRSSWTIKDPTE